ncbi:MAG: PBP1A family penicillin-binding protein [Firmicutes bacterium]|nr:PBP1A family penicillin-binding protein [Bacillota bacterium]
MQRKKEGKNVRPRKVKKNRLKRLLTVVAVLFIFFTCAGAITAYAAIQHFMKDLPAFDLSALEPDKTSFLYDKDGELVTPLMGVENRIIVSLDEMSPYLINAFLAIEDYRFYEHPGFDLRGILRALWFNLTDKSGSMQGGSTITQQLVKNAFLTPERTIKRKIQEVYLAYKLEQVFSKDEILEFYLNRIFFDYNAYGVEAAAQTYFGKSAKDVTLAEAAMLAGIPNLPGKYSPYRNFEEAKKRQKVILERMVEVGMITREEADAAYAEELKLAGIPSRSYPHPWFVDYVIMDELPRLLQTLPDYKDFSLEQIQAKIYTSGLHIYTTLDQRIQQAVTEIIDNPDNYKKLRDETQAAVIVVEPKSGHISAIVGGRNYDAKNSGIFNRATDGKWQAGSVLKPILAYAPAFNEGIATPGTILDDAPTEFPGTPPYYPNNFDMRFQGLMTARQALAASRNVPAARLLNELGIEKGKEYATRMGIQFEEADTGLAMVVGGLTGGVNPLQVAQAYSVLANEGIRTDLTTITKIVDSNGKVIYEHEPNQEEILSPEAAWLTTSCLIDAVRSGTATYLKIGRTVAAKTGTSDKKRDAWMAAYTPDYVTVFWIGEDKWPDKDEFGIYESYYVIGNFMNPILKTVHEDLPESSFKRPESLRQVTICNKSGLLPGEFCPPEHLTTDWFPRNAVPTETCNLHTELEICTVSGKLASEFCPPEHREKQIFFNRPEFITTDKRWAGKVGRGPEDAVNLPPTETCDLHTSRPDGITILKAWQNPFTGDITLTWNEVEGAVGYLVSRKGPDAGDENYVLLTQSPLAVLTFTDTVQLPGVYTYQVVAVNEEGVKSAPLTTSINIETLPGIPFEPGEPEEPGGPEEPGEPAEPAEPENPGQPPGRRRGNGRGNSNNND